MPHPSVGTLAPWNKLRNSRCSNDGAGLMCGALTPISASSDWENHRKSALTADLNRRQQRPSLKNIKMNPQTLPPNNRAKEEKMLDTSGKKGQNGANENKMQMFAISITSSFHPMNKQTVDLTHSVASLFVNNLEITWKLCVILNRRSTT